MVICANGHQSVATDYCDICGAPLDPRVAAVSTGAVPVPPEADEPGQVGSQILPPATSQICPICQTVADAGALFCQSCGYDFITGVAPRGARPASAQPAPPQTPAGQQQPDPAQPLSQSTDQPTTPPPPGETTGATLAVVPVSVGPVAAGAATATPAVASTEAVPVRDAGTIPMPEAAFVESGPLQWVAEIWIDPDWYRVQSSPEALPSPGLPGIVPLRGANFLIGRYSRSRGIVPDIDCDQDTGCSRKQARLSSDGQRWWIEDLGSSNGTYIGDILAPLPTLPITARTEVRPGQRIYVGAWTRIVIRRATTGEVAAFA